jgi:cyclopropane fatty-acyl-phospholipid synthase-like methyltransferase
MNCPICGSLSEERFPVKHVTAAKCAGCNHIYAVGVASDHGVQLLPDPDAMLAQYSARNRRLIARWRHDGLIASNMRIPDFGAGSGHILRSLASELQLDIHCIEAGPEAAKFLRSLGFTVHPDLSSATPGSYDAILLIELLEHLSDPVDFLQAIKRYLKPAGRIFMSTPMGETRSGNRDLPAYDTAEHVQFWTDSSFALACQKAALTFSPVHPSVMYPRKNLVHGLLRDTAQNLRDMIQGRRHLVGYLSAV